MVGQQPCHPNSEGRRNGCLKNLNNGAYFTQFNALGMYPQITAWPFVGKYFRLSLSRDVQKQSVHTTASIGTDNQSRTMNTRGVLPEKTCDFKQRPSQGRRTNERQRFSEEQTI